MKKIKEWLGIISLSLVAMLYAVVAILICFGIPVGIVVLAIGYLMDKF